MTKGQAAGCCPGVSEPCCSVEGIVTVDERGQMVLPKELRHKAGIEAGEKLAAVSFQQGESMCCIALIKVVDLTQMVKGVLGPLMTEVFKE